MLIRKDVDEYPHLACIPSGRRAAGILCVGYQSYGPKLIAYRAEQLGCSLSIVERRVRFLRIPRNTRGTERLSQNCLAVRNSRERCCIKTREWVERTTFHARAHDRRVQEVQVEVGVVPNENRARALGVSHDAANVLK